MGNYLNVGNAGFVAVLKTVYVDKTEMIKFINETLGTKRKLTCFSRPRRFGKSYAAQMLCAYYDKSCDSRELFEGLSISSDPFFEKYLNKYDVIYLDITWFISSADHIKNTVRILQEKVVKELREAYPEAKQDETLTETLTAVNEVTGNKFIIIIDEWDALFREAKDDAVLQKEYIDFLRGLFKNSAFTDKIIEAAYITGILPIKKYGNQSAVSDFKEYSMLMPKQLAKYVGFTEPEVKALCKQYDMDFEEMKRWYDGYSFNRLKSVYSPNSVIEAISSEEFDSYWTTTETYESLRDYIELNFDGLKDSIVDMIGGKRCKINVRTFQNDITSIKNRDDVLTLLVHLGYLAYDSSMKEAFIPNEEVRGEFITAVSEGRRSELAKAVKLSDKLLDATLTRNEEAVAEIIEAAHMAETSPQHYNDEQALRHVVIMAYLTSIDHYLRFEEIASGRGYSDILFLPRLGSGKPALLVELKWDKSADKAITQIMDKQYPEIMKKFGYEGKLLLIGVNYSTKTGKHTCKIEESNG